VGWHGPGKQIQCGAFNARRNGKQVRKRRRGVKVRRRQAASRLVPRPFVVNVRYPQGGRVLRRIRKRLGGRREGNRRVNYGTAQPAVQEPAGASHGRVEAAGGACRRRQKGIAGSPAEPGDPRVEIVGVWWWGRAGVRCGQSRHVMSQRLCAWRVVNLVVVLPSRS